MQAAEIQYELKKRGITQKAVADELGITQMPVSKVINKLIVSSRIMRYVAKRIERDHREVFPEYFMSPPKRSSSKVY